MEAQLNLPVSAGVHIFFCSFHLAGCDHRCAAFDFASQQEGGCGWGWSMLITVDTRMGLSVYTVFIVMLYCIFIYFLLIVKKCR